METSLVCDIGSGTLNDCAGGEVTDVLMNKLRNGRTGSGFHSSTDRELVKIVKENMCYVSEETFEKKKTRKDSKSSSMKNKLDFSAKLKSLEPEFKRLDNQKKMLDDEEMGPVIAQYKVLKEKKEDYEKEFKKAENVMKFKSWKDLVFFNQFQQVVKDNVDIKIENIKKYQQKEDESEYNFLKFEKLYNEENIVNEFSFFKILLKLNVQPILLLLLLSILILISNHLITYFIENLIKLFEVKEMKNQTFFIFTFSLIFLKILNGTMDIIYDRISYGILQPRNYVSISSMIYKKGLKLSKSKSEKDVTTLSKTHTDKVSDVIISFLRLFFHTIGIIVCFYRVFQYIGYTIFSALFIIFISGFIFQKISEKSNEYYTLVSDATDERIKHLKQIISSITMIKNSGLEDYFISKITKLRKKEMKLFKEQNLIDSISNTLWLITSSLVIISIFGIYVLYDFELKTSIAITVISLLQMLTDSLMSIPSCISYIMSSYSSLNQIITFLNLNEVISIKNKKQDENIITIENLNVSILENDNTFILKNINLNFKKNELNLIIGQIGCGKTILLKSICGETIIQSGSIKMNKSMKISYCSEIPYIENNTIRNNILFGNEFLKDKYENVINHCCLFNDFKQFEKGDQTIIGEKGINLSGGQKSRISLARAFYNDSNILILDDPLSSIDVNVSKLIFKNLIENYSKSRTILFATHQTFFFESADKIILMKNGQIEKIGTFNQLKNEGINFNDKIKEFQNDDDLIENLKEKEYTFEEEEEEEEYNELEEEEDDIEYNRFETFKNFIFSIGKFLPILFLIISLIASFTPKMTAMSASNWASDSKYENHSSFYYFTLFSFCSILDSIITYFNNVLNRIIIERISDYYHYKLLKGVIHSPIQFFQDNSTGSIISRYTQDLNSTESFCWKISTMINSILNIFSTILFISIISPLFFLFTIPIFYLIYKMNKEIEDFSKKINKIQSSIEEPLNSFINESIEGIETIRSYKLENEYFKKYHFLNDNILSIYYIAGVKWDWLYFRVICLSQFLLFISLFILILTSIPTAESIGVIISILIDTSSEIQDILHQFGRIDQLLLKIERMKQYINLKNEGNELDYIPEMEWPKYGKIKFQNVNLKYPTCQNYSLKNISFTILPNTKIGISGRTGSGKTSLLKCLLRLIEIEKNDDISFISIDEKDISKIKLSELRSRISIIPQDPILFTGTLRENLDPLNQYSDVEIWRNLKLVKMNEFLKLRNENLEMNIKNGGQNFSLGERQLLCLVRSMLKKTKILIMDEATASLDFQTDEIIQNTIREHFKNSTILVVAHRINTLLDCDKILILENGEMIEFESTNILLKDKKSIFYSLVQNSKQN
eukprot:gene1236-11325_t